MIEKIKSHFWYYFIFLIMQMLGFVWILLLTGNKPMQLLVVFITTSIYTFWALAHHHFHHNLTTKIVIEYVLVGILGISISFFVLA